jgi:hypothetical protein
MTLLVPLLLLLSVRRSRLDGKAPEGSDFANYFCTYAYLYHQVITAAKAAQHDSFSTVTSICYYVCHHCQHCLAGVVQRGVLDPALQ